jgi:signal transduction histidine kinase
MQTSVPYVTILTIIISTLLLLFFCGVIVYFLFLYQNKRHKHSREMDDLKETFDRTLLESKVEIQENTLDHISKELHANIGHLASLININLSTIVPDGSEEMKNQIVETKSLAKQLLSELKALGASLNTDLIMHIGFTSALSNELDRLIRAKKYEVKVTKLGEEFRLKAEHEIILFRLCQEILNNIVKYANAKSIMVQFDYRKENLQLEISDDGVGFNITTVMEQTAVKGSTGLLNIKKRAKMINAVVEIASEKDKGTRFTITAPKNNNKF